MEQNWTNEKCNQIAIIVVRPKCHKTGNPRRTPGYWWFKTQLKAIKPILISYTILLGILVKCCLYAHPNKNNLCVMVGVKPNSWTQGSDYKREQNYQWNNETSPKRPKASGIQNLASLTDHRLAAASYALRILTPVSFFCQRNWHKPSPGHLF